MNFTWTEIGLIATASVTVIATAVPFFKLVAERIDQRKKDKKEKENAHLSLSAEIARLEADREEANRSELRWHYENALKTIEDLKQQRDAAERASIGSRAKQREVNAMLLKISRNLYSMEKGFEEKYHIVELRAIFNAIKKQFVELEDLIP